MRFDLVTLFPAMVEGFLNESMVGRAQQKGLVNIYTHNLRKWAVGKHQQVDDRPFGGGSGMVLKPEPIFSAVNELKTDATEDIIYLCPDGEPLTTSLAQELATKQHLILISGHYEGLDERARTGAITREISIGNYVLTNGTLAAAVLIDAAVRYIPGVLGEATSLEDESFTPSAENAEQTLLSYPQYTRPPEFNGETVPPILQSGHHGDIQKWRHAQRLARTQARRPDLLK